LVPPLPSVEQGVVTLSAKLHGHGHGEKPFQSIFEFVSGFIG
jgi:hypothetical protein